MGYKSFREVYRKLAIVLDDGYCFRMLNLTNPKSVPEGIEVNSVLVYGYIDASQGVSYKILSLTYYEEGDYTMIWPEDEIGITVRGEVFQEYDIIPIENKAIAKRFAQVIKLTDESYGDPEKERTREVTSLDPYRHELMPDDVRVFIRNYHEMKQEGVWARLSMYLGCVDGGREVFMAKMLSEPYDNIYGIHRGDEILVGLIPQKDGTTVLLGVRHPKRKNE